MTPIRISIPVQNPPTEQLRAAKIIVDALIEAGIDPKKKSVQENELFCGCLAAWGRREWTRSQFIHACKNLLVFRPDWRL